MAKLSKLKEASTHRVLLFGGPKTGKTLLAGKLAEHFKIIYIGMENGHETLFSLPESFQDNVEVISLPDTSSYPIAIETCLKVVKSSSSISICEEHGKVSCMVCKREEKEVTELDLKSLTNKDIVIFDSLTQLTASAIANITKAKPDDYKLEFDDWGHLGKLLEIFLSHIQQASYNVIVISHEVVAETEGKKNVLVPVAGTRNASRNVAKFFDHVVYAEKKNKKHVFASGTSYSNNILTGSRTGVELESLEADSLLPIFKPEAYANSVGTVSTVSTVSKQASKVLSKLSKQVSK